MKAIVMELFKARTPGDKRPRKRKGSGFGETDRHRESEAYESGLRLGDSVKLDDGGRGKIVDVDDANFIVLVNGERFSIHPSHLDKSLAKARTPGAKDIRPRRKRRAAGHVLTVAGYEKGSVEHPEVDFYHKLDTGEMVLVNKKTGRWSHYDNEHGFTKEGSSHKDLRSHLVQRVNDRIFGR